MKHTVLLVDDDPVVVLMMKHLIIKHGLCESPLAFKNGLEAIEYLQKDYSQDVNYIILLDLNMPVMDGWKFLDELKSIAHPENTFVFIVTSSSDKSDKESVGANKYVHDFFVKPMLADTVLYMKQVVDKQLINKQ